MRNPSGPGSGHTPIERPQICLQLTCLVTEAAPCHAERTIHAIDSQRLWPSGPVRQSFPERNGRKDGLASSMTV